MDTTAASTGQQILDDLTRAGFERGGLLAVALAPGTGLAVAVSGGPSSSAEHENPVEVVRRIEEAYRPRWVLWGSDTPTTLVAAGLAHRDVLAHRRSATTPGRWLADGSGPHMGRAP